MEAEWYCHPQKCGNRGDTQSVENQVGQDEEPAEEILSWTVIPMYRAVAAITAGTAMAVSVFVNIK